MPLDLPAIERLGARRGRRSLQYFFEVTDVAEFDCIGQQTDYIQ